MIKVAGILTKGYGVASGIRAVDSRFAAGSIRMQMPYFRQLGLDFDQYFENDWIAGTLNITVEAFESFTIFKPDFHFRNMKWVEFDKPEDFLLVETTVVFHGIRYRGLIYQVDPETKMDHPHQSNMIEVISKSIPKIEYGNKVELEIDDTKIKLIPKHHIS